MKLERALEILSREPKPELSPWFAVRTQRRLPAGGSSAFAAAFLLASGAAIAFFGWPELFTRILFFGTPIAFGIWSADLRIRFGGGRD